jgi:uncharacterized protein (TIGR01777 family)
LRGLGHDVRPLGRNAFTPLMLDGADAVVHLGGANIAEGRWTRARKREIRDSRVVGTERLAQALAAMARRPTVLVSASAVGYYGAPAGDVDESAPRGDDFLARVCADWEAAADAARAAGVRVAHPRFGIVLSTAGGALAKQMPLFRRGLGAILGDGTAPLPWVTLDDTIAALELLLTQPLEGVFNVTARLSSPTSWRARSARTCGCACRMRCCASCWVSWPIRW